MPTDLVPDETLVQRLPLPLAQLYRRAHNAKGALERHLTAFYLWEASLKLLGAVAVVEYARQPCPDPHVAERLQNLARPAIGHWWEFLRLLVPVLAEQGDAGFGKVRDLLLGRTRDDLPRAAGLDAALREVLDGNAGSRATVRLTELYERLVRYRNQELGHGAAGQRSADFYERMSRALLAGVPEVLSKLDVLAGRRLLHVAEVRQTSGIWLVQRYELVGESPRRIESLELPLTESANLPIAERVYLDDPDGLRPLHPLVIHDADAEETLFLNARRGKKRTEYLCYNSGRTLDRADLGGEQRELIARVLGMSVAAEQVEQWAARSQADEPPASGGCQSPEGHRTLGEFELLSELGRGGMGVVYRAWQPSLGRQVALKSLLRSGDAKSEARFRREIKALGRVEHPHLVKIFTSGSDGDRWFYAMELVEGAPLSSVCERLQGTATSVDLPAWQAALSTVCEEARKAEKSLSDETGRGRGGGPTPGRPPTPAAPQGADPPRSPGKSYVRHIVELMKQVAEAAHALHERGIIHRDIKPGNILLGADGGHAVLMDLGLAQLADAEEGRLTRTRQFVGTLRYASPEQVLAAARLDRRTDVYSLGATLWELLTLRPLFGATDDTPTPELMQKIQLQEPERLRNHNPGVSRDLEAIVHKGLEKFPDGRYATAAELARDLQRYLDGEPVRARKVSDVERDWRWARRHPAPAALMVLTMLLLVGGVLGSLIYQYQLRETRAAALVQALHSADTAAVPVLVDELAAYRRWADPALRRLMQDSPEGSRERLHAALALLPVETAQADYLAERMLTGRPEELVVVRTALRPHAAGLVERYWTVVEDEQGGAGRRLRAAAALAAYDPGSPRWAKVQKAIVRHLVAENVLVLGHWIEAFRPVRTVLVPELAEMFRDSLRPETERTLATNFLAEYVADQPAVLADLLADADERQFAVLFPFVQALREQVLPILNEELSEPIVLGQLNWNVRFYQWERVGPMKPPADWDAVVQSPILEELQAPALSFHWQTGLPSKKVPNDHFAVAATADVVLQHHSYILTVTYDDGIRVWLDGKVVFENWAFNGETTESISVVPSSGRHVLKVEYFQIDGGYALGCAISVPDDAKEKGPSRRANAAAALVRLQEAASVWPLLQHRPDPGLRTMLLHRLAPLGVDPLELVRRLEVEPDVSAQRALILSLGEFSAAQLPASVRAELVPKLLQRYRTDPDPGIHGAIDWLLRYSAKAEQPAPNAPRPATDVREEQLPELLRRYRSTADYKLRRDIENLVGQGLGGVQPRPLDWGQAAEMARIDQELAGRPADGRRWYVNKQGHTMVVIPGPVEFTMGDKGDGQHRRRIGRSFAVATTEVTQRQFAQFLRANPMVKEQPREGETDRPKTVVSWYMAAQYCRWLSEQDPSIPESQYCYPSIAEIEKCKDGKTPLKLPADYLSRTGYRLPSEAEWEYACRAGAGTTYYHGNSPGFLGRYAVYSESQSRTVGQMKPNDLGLADTLGNVWEWCQEGYGHYASGIADKPVEDKEDINDVLGSNRRVIRGGSFDRGSNTVRCATYGGLVPSEWFNMSFRVARTSH